MTLSSVVSRYVGIVTDFDEILPLGGDAWLFHAVALTADAMPLFGYRPDHSGPITGGYDSDRNRATTAAIGEAVERYAGAYVPDEHLTLAAAKELEGTPAPETFALFAPEQYAVPGFPFVPFTSKTRIRWAPGVRLADGSPAFLPAQLVYLPWAAHGDGEERIGYSTSNGLACGATRGAALLSALLELLERDAFMIAWYARLSLPRLDVSRHPELLAWERRYLRPAGLRHEVVDLSAFHGVPTALAVVHADGRSAGELGVGAGAARTVEEAWRKALCEAYAVRAAARVMADAVNGVPPSFDDVTTFNDHVALYAYAEHAHRAAFLDGSPLIREAGDVEPLPELPPDELVTDLVARLHERGIETYACDLTTPDVAEAGLHVVRALAPSLCPLDARHDARFLGGERLRTVPAELSLRERALAFEDLNPDPHPFP